MESDYQEILYEEMYESGLTNEWTEELINRIENDEEYYDVND
jgi:hypothetical protein